MPQQSSAALLTLDKWQQWEGRVMGGRHQLLQYLGGSDHSAVYLTDFGGARAIAKLVPADAPEADVQLARWEAACNLTHPNLLRVYETGRWHADDQQDMFFAVMEYADENLGEIVCERALTPTEAREMLVPALAALEYLHGRNLVHGCLKPTNVMAVGPQLKLAVDGIRRSGTRLTSVEQEDWRAVPEVFNAGVSSRNDIWALGLLLVEALTRQKPKLEKGGDVAVQVPNEMVEPFRSIAQECLQRDPSKRCSIAEIRRMLERPVESVKTAAQVVPIRTESKQEAKPQTGDAVPQTRAEQPKDSESSTQAIDLPSMLDEAESVQSSSKRFAPLAIAILLAIVGVVALVRLASRHTNEPKAQAQTTTSAANPAAVQPTSASAVSPPTRPVSGSVAKQVMPDVSHVAQNTIHGVVKVRVKVNVNESGEVILAGLATRGPSRYFARQALEAARQWAFTAPMLDGKPAASRWMLQFDFRRSGVKAESRMIEPKA